MKKVFVTLLASGSMFLASCGGGGWTEEAKSQIVEGCMMAGDKEACECYAEKVTSSMTPSEVTEEGAVEKMSKMMMDCMGLGE